MANLKGKTVQAGKDFYIDLASSASHAREGISISTAMVCAVVEKETEKAVCLRGWIDENTTHLLWLPKSALTTSNLPGDVAFGIVTDCYQASLAKWFNADKYQSWFLSRYTELSNTTATDSGIARSHSAAL